MGFMRKRRLSSYKQGRPIEHFVAGTSSGKFMRRVQQDGGFLFSSSARDNRP